MDIIQLLLNQIQELNKIIKYLLVFICKFIPLKQWIHDDSHSPKYQKFKVDKLPVIQYFEKLDYIFLIKYYMHRYGVDTKPIRHKSTCSIPENTVCPRCGAPSQYNRSWNCFGKAYRIVPCILNLCKQRCNYSL